MQSEDLVFETAPAEKGKNGSLTSRALLRRPGCEAGFSAFSCNLNGFGGPNRDYAWEGFTANCGKEDWKFLDALFVRPVKNGEAFPLTATKVELSPWKAAYHYSAGNAKPVIINSIGQKGIAVIRAVPADQADALIPILIFQSSN